MSGRNPNFQPQPQHYLLSFCSLEIRSEPERERENHKTPKFGFRFPVGSLAWAVNDVSPPPPLPPPPHHPHGSRKRTRLHFRSFGQEIKEAPELPTRLIGTLRSVCGSIRDATRGCGGT